MPLSSHLRRKLEEALGMDAADEFSNIVDTYDAMRADLAELRHGIDVIQARLGEFATKTELAELRGELNAQFQAMRTESQAMRAEFQAELRKQTQWALGAVITVMLAIFFSR